MSDLITEIPVMEVPVWALRTVAPFKTLFPEDECVFADILQDMEEHGFDPAHPIIVWNMLVIDGHTRLKAAQAAGIEKVPVYVRSFTDENDALEYAIQSQVSRRNLTDGELIQCLQKLDYRKKAGHPQKMDTAPRGKSSEHVAQLLGISCKKVERLRAIMNYGTDEIKEALRQGKCTVNGAYQATMAPRRKNLNSIPDADAEAVHAVMADIHSRLNSTQIRKLIKALQLELATN